MSEESRHIRVLIIQPVIAHYRIPLFEGLSRVPGFDLRLLASRTLAGFPESVASPPAWADTSHRAFHIGDQLYWQRGLKVPRAFEAGDVLVIDGNPRFLSNVPLLLDARRRGVGVVSWGHGWSPTSKAWRAQIRYRYMERADIVLVYTDEEVQKLTAQRPWRVPLRASNNAIDETRFAAAAAAWTAADLATFEREKDLVGRNVLLFCGRLRLKPSTELDVAIRALAHSKERGEEYVLAIVGSGEGEEPLRRLSAQLGVDHLLRWAGAQYAERDLAPWFLSARCFVYPGAIGLSLLHAFGYGLPTITHDARRLQPPEIAALRDGGNGLLFKRGDPIDLCNKIRLVCEDPALRARMSANARATVQSEFSMSAMIRRFSSAIRLASDAAVQRASRSVAV